MLQNQHKKNKKQDAYKRDTRIHDRYNRKFVECAIIASHVRPCRINGLCISRKKRRKKKTIDGSIWSRRNG